MHQGRPADLGNTSALTTEVRPAVEPVAPGGVYDAIIVEASAKYGGGLMAESSNPRGPAVASAADLRLGG